MKKLISRCNFLKTGALASAVMMLAACGGGAGGGKDSAANVDVTGTVSSGGAGNLYRYDKLSGRQ